MSVMGQERAFAHIGVGRLTCCGRVEWLQREICLGYLQNDDRTGAERTYLDPPVPILLIRHEKLILQRSGNIIDLLAS